MTELRLRSGLLTVFVFVCVLYLREAVGFRELAAWAPLFAGSTALLLLGLALLRDVLRNIRSHFRHAVTYRRTIEFKDEDVITGENVRAMWRYLAWVLGLMALVAALGLRFAAPLYIGLFLRLDGRFPLRFVATAIVGTIAALWFFGNVVGFVWPESIFTNPY